MVLIVDDPDDNKYSDCVIAAGALYLVTEYKHFSILKNIPFPEINTLSLDGFVEFLERI